MFAGDRTAQGKSVPRSRCLEPQHPWFVYLGGQAPSNLVRGDGDSLAMLLISSMSVMTQMRTGKQGCGHTVMYANKVTCPEHQDKGLGWTDRARVSRNNPETQ